MKDFLNMLNALNQVKPISLDGKIIKEKAQQVIVDHLRQTGAKFIYTPGKGFVEDTTPGEMHFKDEGGFYTTKFTKDGEIPETGKLYPFGSLNTVTVYTHKQAKDLAKSKGMKAVFG